MINGQGLGKISELKYGLFPMSFNGCEIIAVYNALEYLGKSADIGDVLHFMKRYCILFGLFGGNIYCLDKALKHFGAEARKVKSADNVKAFIISSWTGKYFLSTIHTVFCVRMADGIRVYNRYNKCPYSVIYKTDDIKNIFGGNKPLTVYHIK